jgi:hypothetical protein
MDTIDYGVQPDMTQVNRVRARDLEAAKAALAGQRLTPAVNPAIPAPVASAAGPTLADRASAGLRSVLPAGEPGVVSKLARGAAGALAKGGAVVGPAVEAVQTGRVALDPNATGIDVATQGAEGIGKLGAAGVGAGLGAMVGGPVGALAGGAAGYFGGQKLIEGLRSAVGVDTSSPVDRVPGGMPAPTVAPAADSAAAPVANMTPGRTPRAPVNVPLAAPATPAPAAVSSPPAPSLNVAAPGGGYLPGAGATSQALSAARMAAADRGDFDSVAASYQNGGGTFNGQTAAEDQVQRLNKAVGMSAPGSKRQLSYMAQRDAISAQGAARQAGEAAKVKSTADVAKTTAETEKARADTAGTRIANDQKTRVQQMIQQLADLDGSTDPDGTKRRALQDNILAIVHGKDATEHQYQTIDLPTGTENPLTNAPNVIKGIFDKRAGKIVNTPKAGEGAPAGMKQVGTARGRPVYEDAQGKRFQGAL